MSDRVVARRIAAAITVGMRRYRMRSRFATAVVLAVALPVSAPAFTAPAPRADPATLFEGRSTGEGELALLFGRDRAFQVESQGRRQADGSFRLDQVIRFDGATPRVRHWIIREAGERRFTFELSDAAGPGTAIVDGARLTLRYPLARGGVRMQQVLELAPDGRSIANTGTIRWLGIPIGRLSETIIRADPATRSRKQAAGSHDSGG